ncbi:MAG: hypothetical protein JNJ57_04595 [Saprospiraceae bacterium]|nr:hypothetical protein [Saprospiraceae bacterium]
MAIIPAPTIYSKCIPKSDGTPILLKVTAGNAQLNEGSYFINPSVQTPASQSGPLKNGISVDIGDGLELIGQRLSVYVTVVATTGLMTNLELTLVGGSQNLHFTNSLEVPEIGDVVVYEAYIKFTKS